MEFVLNITEFYIEHLGFGQDLVTSNRMTRCPGNCHGRITGLGALMMRVRGGREALSSKEDTHLTIAKDIRYV